MNKHEFTAKIYKRKKMYIDNSIEFQTIFGIRLFNYSDLINGFDIVKFDEYIETPDGKSIEEYVKEKYGKKAVQLILKLSDA